MKRKCSIAVTSPSSTRTVETRITQQSNHPWTIMLIILQAPILKVLLRVAVGNLEVNNKLPPQVLASWISEIAVNDSQVFQIIKQASTPEELTQNTCSLVSVKLMKTTLWKTHTKAKIRCCWIYWTPISGATATKSKTFMVAPRILRSRIHSSIKEKRRSLLKMRQWKVI